MAISSAGSNVAQVNASLFGSIIKIGGGIIKGFAKGGPIGGVIGGLGQLGGGGGSQRLPFTAPPRGLVPRGGSNCPAGTTPVTKGGFLGIGGQILCEPIPGGNPFVPGPVGGNQPFGPSNLPEPQAQQPQGVSGVKCASSCDCVVPGSVTACRPNGRKGRLNACGQCVPKKPKMNPFNPSALKRANRRREAFVRGVKSSIKGSGLVLTRAGSSRTRQPARPRKGCSC